MIRAWIAAAVFAAGVAGNCLAENAATPSDPRPVPSFGMIWNNDGDLSFTGETPQESERNFRRMIDRLAATPTRTLCLSVGAGSDILYYPTKVASTWGWRELPNDPEPIRTKKAKAGTDSGMDAPRIAMDETKKLGIAFIPSLRMNDWHFCANAPTDPLTSRFWMENHEKLTIGKGKSPMNDPSAAHECENLLDFTREEVRQFRLAQIKEIVDRYQDGMAGIELDFNRVQVFFPKGGAAKGALLMTKLIKDVRQYLDDAGAKSGKTFYLLVRVPPTLKNCHWAGLDVDQWMQQRLVDVVIPAQLMTLSSDMPVDEFVAAGKGRGCKVYPAIYPRSGPFWPYRAKVPDTGYPGGPERRASAEMFRGAASNYWNMGASGFQIYNFGWADDDWTILGVHALTQPAALSRQDRTYAMPTAYYLDSEDNYEYRKQIPITLQPGKSQDLVLYVGERFDDAAVNSRPDHIGLRIGLRNAEPKASIEISLNGTTLNSSAVEQYFHPTYKSDVANAPSAYVQIEVKDASLVKAGKNRVTLKTSDKGIDVVWCDLAVQYNSKVFSW